MEQLVVERSIWIQAPRERVWQAVTDPEQVAQWFLPPMLGASMKRDASGKIFVCMGEMEVPVAAFEASEPPQRFTSRGLPDGLIATTYTLEEENRGTRVTVTMTGFESLPEDARQDRFLPSGASWEKALENLKSYVDSAQLPFPEGYTAALFGYRRETKDKFSVERSIWIDASRERVWAAITDPKLVQEWFSPTTPWELSALEVGGRLYVKEEETGNELYVQVIEQVEPPRRFITRSAPPEIPYVTVYVLEEENGGTRLTLTHSGYELAPEDSRPNSMEQNAFGFGMMLENLRAQVEGRELPYPFGF
jgi:uncharacterized protein YndB with AHSA1/START domain